MGNLACLKNRKEHEAEMIVPLPPSPPILDLGKAESGARANSLQDEQSKCSSPSHSIPTKKLSSARLKRSLEVELAGDLEAQFVRLVTNLPIKSMYLLVKSCVMCSKSAPSSAPSPSR